MSLRKFITIVEEIVDFQNYRDGAKPSRPSSDEAVSSLVNPEFTQAYIHAALERFAHQSEVWADHMNGRGSFGIQDLADSAVAEMSRDCEIFQKANGKVLEALYAAGATPQTLGASFCFLRSGISMNRPIANLSDGGKDAGSFGKAWLDFQRATDQFGDFLLDRGDDGKLVCVQKTYMREDVVDLPRRSAPQPTHATQGLDEFTRGYVEVALYLFEKRTRRLAEWSDFDPDTARMIVQDCKKFQGYNEALLKRAYAAGMTKYHAGSTFYILRNGERSQDWLGLGPVWREFERATDMFDTFRLIDRDGKITVDYTEGAHVESLALGVDRYIDDALLREFNDGDDHYDLGSDLQAWDKDRSQDDTPIKLKRINANRRNRVVPALALPIINPQASSVEQIRGFMADPEFARLKKVLGELDRAQNQINDRSNLDGRSPGRDRLSQMTGTRDPSRMSNDELDRLDGTREQEVALAPRQTQAEDEAFGLAQRHGVNVYDVLAMLSRRYVFGFMNPLDAAEHKAMMARVRDL